MPEELRGWGAARYFEITLNQSWDFFEAVGSMLDPLFYPIWGLERSKMDAKMKARAKKLHPGAQNGPMQAPGGKSLELLTLQGRFLASPGDPKITQKVVF